MGGGGPNEKGGVLRKIQKLIIRRGGGNIIWNWRVNCYFRDPPGLNDISFLFFCLFAFPQKRSQIKD